MEAVGQRRGIRGGLRVDWDVRRDALDVSRPSLAIFLCRALLQSHFRKLRPVANGAQAAVVAGPGRYLLV